MSWWTPTACTPAGCTTTSGVTGRTWSLEMPGLSSTTAARTQKDTQQAERYLSAAVMMLRMDDHDFFEHTTWPFSSWDILSNLFFLRQGWPFVPKHQKVPDSQWVRSRLPLVYPPHGPRCWPRCAEEEATPRVIKVWWTSKNPGPFVDFATILEEWVSDRYVVDISHNALADHCEYARYKDWLCSKDVRLKEVLREQTILSQMSQAECGEERGQWCGLRELHLDFEEVKRHFDARLSADLRQMDLFACGHPLFWCRLVESYGSPILGIWDMTHSFAVPEMMQEAWTGAFLNLFAQKQNLLVAMSAYHSFQVRWLLGWRVPYFQPITADVSLHARYQPLRAKEVLLSKFRGPYDIQLLLRMAKEAGDDFPLRFVPWDDLPCGRDCSKAELGHFRACVLSAYDTSPMKLTEFYALAMPLFIFRAGLWRTAMRWAKADAKSGGVNASLPGRSAVLLNADTATRAPDGASIALALQQETQAIPWHDPWGSAASEGPPFQDLPYSPFMENRNELLPPGAGFWVQLTDWALLPHLLHYESAGHLLSMLAELSLQELQNISARMVAHYSRLLVASVNFWRGIIQSLVEGDASRWKG
ncbi:unnamed protein product [Effrenium voratum]|nr:unnamed protein product [Effrenium voratum]